ncbi:MAG TPA: PD-(D/E)XK nuclease-like domain-containing protein [Salinarimonas sp.]|nr:PD-(D/E)XK nuclease-like domain-containing protein [Salinarimonas sp.]
MVDIDYQDFNEVEPAVPVIANLPAVQALGKEPFVPGVVFGMDQDKYHAVPALSNTGIKHLLISETDYWARSWMNTNPIEEPPEESEAKKIGKAYDKRITEGREAFYRSYAAALDASQHTDALRTMEDLRDAIRDLGQKPKGKSKADLANQLLTLAPGAKVWDHLVSEHEQFHAGKVMLHPGLIRRIEIAAAMIEKSPGLRKAFTGGMAQVAIFWVCPHTGVPMKALLDYLKPKAIVDLKTFANKRGLPIKRAIALEIANYGYHIQTAVYHEAANQLAGFIKDGLVRGDVAPEFLQAVAAADSRTFMFVFQQKGIAPVAKGRVLPKMNVYDIARIQVRTAKETFARCVETFGPDMWIDPSDIDEIDDTEIPAYIGT